MFSKIPRILSEPIRFFVYGLMALVLILVIIRFQGLRLAFETVTPEETHPIVGIQFDPKGEVRPLEQNFPLDAVPQNVVYMIGDGMGHAHVLAARAELVGLDGRLAMEQMPVSGWVDTRARTSLGNDSAGGATALATGVKVRPGRLSLNREDEVLRTLAEEAIAHGLEVGLVTDSYLWDATTAAFVTHVEKRGERAIVAAQMATSGVSFMAGTLPRGYPPAGENWDKVVADLEKNHFTLARQWNELLEAGPGPAAALFDYGVIANSGQAPNLEDLATLAIDRLDIDRGFFLVFEGEEIDTASHRHDWLRLMAGMENFDHAIGRILDFAMRDRETLVIVTADHECGGLHLHHAGPGKPLEITWSSTGHTALPVPLYAYGPGAERFAGVHDNTEIAQKLADLMGWTIGKVDESTE